jgi:cell wall-associated NlpC family hydrolase
MNGCSSRAAPPRRYTVVVPVLLLLACALAVVGGRAAPASAATTCGVKQSGAAASANAAVTKACGLLGTPYSWGGGHGATPGLSYGACDPSNGAPNDCNVRGLDCSGMVRYAYYLATGADVIPGTSASQFASSRAVARYYRSSGTAPLLPGDLVFFGGSASSIHHVAMYLGQG